MYFFITDDSAIDYVDSAFEKEIKQQKNHHVVTPLVSPQASNQLNSSKSETDSITTETELSLSNSNSKSSSVKDKIMLFTKNKRSSFHAKRPNSQFVIENHGNAVISRKPSSTKQTSPSVPSFKTNNSLVNQPSQLILPDLGKQITEPVKIPLKQKSSSARNSIKEAAEVVVEEVVEEAPIKIEFKSVKDRVAYFSSRKNEEKAENTPVLATITTCTTTITTTTTSSMASATPKSTTITTTTMASTTPRATIGATTMSTTTPKAAIFSTTASTPKSTLFTTTTTTTTMAPRTIMTTPKIIPSVKLNTNLTKPLKIIENNELSRSLIEPLSISPNKTTSSTNISKLANIMTASATNLASNSFCNNNNNNNNNKNATKLEVKNVLIGNSNENKISNLIQKFTKRK
jgi:hypothetical protein